MSSVHKRRSDGERSRSAILDAAMRLATVEGLEGVSISRLADAVGMSKSGLFAHFGSKEGLQLATVEAADAVFADQVIAPSAGAATGLERLRALADGYLRYIEAGTFPGGCFFASALTEVSMRPGPVRDRVVAVFDDWLAQLEAAAAEAQLEDPAQVAFEIEAALLLANAQYAVARGPEPIDRARRAIERAMRSPTAATAPGT